MLLGIMMRTFLIFGILLLFIIALGCEKPECRKNTDCAEKEYNAATCTDGKCQYSVTPNKCGNGKCEISANENVCSCPNDCQTPKCEGKYKIERPGERAEDARLLSYYCDGPTCRMGVKTSTPRYLKEIEREPAFGKVTVKVDYAEPMDVKKNDKFKVILQLIELAPDIKKDDGVSLYQISFFSRDRFAEKTLNNVALKNIREPIPIEVPLTIPTIPYKELISSVTMRINYGFTRRDKISATEFKDTPRTGTLEYDLPDRVTFIESGERPEK